jgi:hypothetical protein
MESSLATLTAESFEPYRGETFSLMAGGSELALTLATVQRLGNAMRAGGAFSLQFSGPAGPIVPQATYPLRHGALGTLELFLVPLRPENGLSRYEVIFT